MITLKKTEDIPLLLRWRAEVIKNVFGEEADESLMQANEHYYKKHLADGSHLAFIAEMDGKDVGCGSICLSEELPSPDNPDGRCAYLMNIYVRNDWRKRNIGHNIVQRLIEEARIRNCDKIYLETTEEGRGLYESLGFKDLPDMMKLCR